MTEKAACIYEYFEKILIKYEAKTGKEGLKILQNDLFGVNKILLFDV
jgi:hypothetical protein